MAVALGASAVVGMPAQAATSSCDLVPVHRDTTVNQGLGSYDPLVRGKEALVRFFLSKPGCATQTDVIEITGARLTVTGGNATPTIKATPELGLVYPQLPPHSTSPAADTPGNPLFVVPPTAVDAAGTSSFTVSFVAEFDYRSISTTGGTTSGTVKFPSADPVTRTVAAPSGAHRVLVVPMGNPADAGSFTSEALGALHVGMANLARVLPVRSGIGDLAAGGNPGLRYTVLEETLLDLTNLGGVNAMRPTGDSVHPLEYCHGGFSAIGEQLAAFRNLWNSENPSAPADRVMGVIWEDIAPGVTGGCEEGRAYVTGREAWSRISSTVGATVLGKGDDRTGAVLAMETVHNFGGAYGSHANGSYHSNNFGADGTSPNRAYNIAQRRYLGDDRTALQITPGWKQGNVLLEKPDWELSHCVLRGGSRCGGSTGSSSAAEGPSFAISGTIDGDDTDLFTYGVAVPTGAVDADQEASGYSVALFDSLAPEAAPSSEIPVPVRFDASHHLDGAVHDDAGVIDVVVPKADSTLAFEVRHGADPLYRRTKLQAPEVLVATELPALGSRRLVSVTAKGSPTNAVRASLLLTGCGSRSPLVVDADPTVTTAVIDGTVEEVATYLLPYDRSRVCSAGSLDVHVTDGFTPVTKHVDGVQPSAPTPFRVSAAITSPEDGATFVQYDPIPIAGTVRNDRDEAWPEADLRWSLVLADGTERVLGTGSKLPDISPDLPGGWPVGDEDAVSYLVRLDVLDGSDVVEAREVTITVQKDEDHDNDPAPEPPCQSDQDGGDAFVDHDHDGLVGAADDDPCTSANNVVVDFDPDTLYVPSVGNFVTMHVTGDDALLAAVDPATVRITQVGGYTVDLAADSWSYDGARATVKVDRQRLNALMATPGWELVADSYIPVLLEAAGTASAIRGIDPASPIVKRG